MGIRPRNDRGEEQKRSVTSRVEDREDGEQADAHPRAGRTRVSSHSLPPLGRIGHPFRADAHALSIPWREVHQRCLSADIDMNRDKRGDAPRRPRRLCAESPSFCIRLGGDADSDLLVAIAVLLDDKQAHGDVVAAAGEPKLGAFAVFTLPRDFDGVEFAGGNLDALAPLDLVDVAREAFAVGDGVGHRVGFAGHEAQREEE